jgi:hypothetical protein
VISKTIKLILFLGVLAILLYLYFTFKKENSTSLENSTNLIQQQIVNVGKLVVTEGHFSEVLTYKDQNSYFGGIVSFDKKALIVVNAEVTVAYNLHDIKYDINSETKTITLLNIPKEEIKIYPDIQFYDVNQSKLNPFTGDDYNKINKLAKLSLSKKIEKSSLKSNAENRLISELSKMLILSNSMGWKLEYQGKIITKEEEFLLAKKL